MLPQIDCTKSFDHLRGSQASVRYDDGYGEGNMLLRSMLGKMSRGMPTYKHPRATSLSTS